MTRSLAMAEPIEKSGGRSMVHVRAHTREGYQVSAYDRSHRPSEHIFLQYIPRLNLLSFLSTQADGVPYDFQSVMARRPEDTLGGHRPRVVPDSNTGGSGGLPRSTSSAPPAPVSPRSQGLVDIIAPNGRPIGEVVGEARSTVRTLRGGDEAAKTMFRRLTEGRGAVEVVPPRADLQVVRLNDGSFITYRPTSSSGPPAVDVIIPGFPQIRRLRFVD